jgi:hypothetical protein
MDIISLFVEDAQSAKLVEPGKTPLDDPAPSAQSAAVLGLHREQGHDAAATQPLPDSGLTLSICDISSDHVQVVAGGFERLLGIMVRNKPGVIIKGHIALPARRSKTPSSPACFLSMRDRTKSMMAM